MSQALYLKADKREGHKRQQNTKKRQREKRCITNEPRNNDEKQITDNYKHSAMKTKLQGVNNESLWVMIMY